MPAALTTTPDELKKRYKQLTRGEPSQRSYEIRTHRCCSWLDRASKLRAGEQAELRFLLLWIAFNCLYSTWDALSNRPAGDTQSRNEFLRTLCRLDPSGTLASVRSHRPLLKKIDDDPFLSDVFWRDPFHAEAKARAVAATRGVNRHLKDGRADLALIDAFGRLFVLRGQIVHGASSGGSRLNRTAVNYAVELLDTLVPHLARSFVEHGSEHEWPDVCYPPLQQKAGTNASTFR